MRFGPSQLSCVGSSVVECSVWSIECRGFESYPRQLIFLRKSAVLLCLVCLFDLACFFLSSLIKNMYMYNVMYTCSTTQFFQKAVLQCASESDRRETVQLLLEKGADPNAQDKVSVLLKSCLYLDFQYIPQHVMVHCLHAYKDCCGWSITIIIARC